MVETLAIRHGAEWFIVRYQRGEEADVLLALSAMAQDPRLPFDWRDAAVMAHEVGRRAASALKSFHPKDPT